MSWSIRWGFFGGAGHRKQNTHFINSDSLLPDLLRTLPVDVFYERFFTCLCLWCGTLCLVLARELLFYALSVHRYGDNFQGHWMNQSGSCSVSHSSFIAWLNDVLIVLHLEQLFAAAGVGSNPLSH